MATGLREAGYVYVNLDDCWMGRFRNNVTGQLVPGKNFPNGMKALGEMIHAKGLKYGSLPPDRAECDAVLPCWIDEQVFG